MHLIFNYLCGYGVDQNFVEILMKFLKCEFNSKYPKILTEPNDVGHSRNN